MRNLVIGDIHGGLRGLEQLIDIAKITNDDKLIFLGDYVDGWSESAQVISRIIELAEKQVCIIIRGNHDIWCENWLRTGETDKVWLEHGGIGTMDSYSGFSESEKKQHLQFFENMLPFYIDDKNRLFIHAGFTSQYGVEYELLKQNYYFDRSLWYESLKLKSVSKDDKDRYPARNKLYNEIYIGHTPTLNFNEKEPMKALNVYDIDTGAAFYGKLSAMDIDTKEVFQTEVVNELYPGEIGRNKV